MSAVPEASLESIRDGNIHYYADLPEEFDSTGKWTFEQRWADVERFADLRPDDEVLDAGCAEGLITMAVAGRVKSARGIEVQAPRIDAAQRIAADRGLGNVTFECGCLSTAVIEPMGYDVVLFLGVLHHMPADTHVPTLWRLFAATRRRILVKTPMEGVHGLKRLMMIAQVCKEMGFAGEAIKTNDHGGSVFVAERRG